MKIMETFVNVTENGDVVADTKAIEYARTHVGETVNIGTMVMLDAFRALTLRGVIEKLQVSFDSGDLVNVDKNGTLEYWPENEMSDAGMNLLAELAGFLEDGNKTDK